MKNKKISCGIHYRPCHLNTIYDDHSCHIISGLPKSEEDGSTTVSIPFHEKLTGQEIDYIIEYTGMDIVMEYPLDRTPVVFFSRNGNVLDFVTMFSTELNNT